MDYNLNFVSSILVILEFCLVCYHQHLNMFFATLSDLADGSSFAKLFVGSVPKTAREEDVSKLMPNLCRNLPFMSIFILGLPVCSVLKSSYILTSRICS